MMKMNTLKPWPIRRRSEHAWIDPNFKKMLDDMFPDPCVKFPEKTRRVMDMLNSTKNNKKASVQDITYVLIVVFVLAIGSLMAFKISDSLNTKFQNSTLLESRGKTAFNQITNIYPTVLDNSFMFLMIGLCIVALALASMVRVHPVFLIFFIIILVIIIFLSGVFSNVYQKIGSDPNFLALANRMVYMTYTMRFLPFITGIFGFILAFVMYKSWQNA